MFCYCLSCRKLIVSTFVSFMLFSSVPKQMALHLNTVGSDHWVGSTGSYGCLTTNGGWKHFGYLLGVKLPLYRQLRTGGSPNQLQGTDLKRLPCANASCGSCPDVPSGLFHTCLLQVRRITSGLLVSYMQHSFTEWVEHVEVECGTTAWFTSQNCQTKALNPL